MRVVPAFLLALLLFAVAPAQAATFRVDDSASLPRDSALRMNWLPIDRSRRGGAAMEGTMAVTVRLDMTPFLQRSGRLYLVLADAGVGPVKATWTTRGRLQPGEVSAGQRTLVRAGPVTERLLEDFLTLKIEIDGARSAARQKLDFHFEIDLD